MKIGVAGGCGIIGKALVNWLKKIHTVAVYDPPAGVTDDMKGCQAIFICVPCPTLPNREQLLGDIKGVIEQFKDQNTTFILRSTVLPGTADMLSKVFNVRIISCPEFLTQRTANEDVEKHDIVCGDGDLRLMSEIFVGKQLRVMSNVEAEIAKYAHNCYGAVKVHYFNTIYNLCRVLHQDYEKVIEGIGVTGFIEKTHTQVPGPDGQFGYGGKCFPKNMSSFIGFLHTKMIDSSYLRRIEVENEAARIRPKLSGSSH